MQNPRRASTLLAVALTAATTTQTPGQTLTPASYTGFPATGQGTVRVGKPQVAASLEYVLVDFSAQPWPIVQRAVDGSPLAAHDATHEVATYVTPTSLAGLVGVYAGGVLAANAVSLDFGAGLAVDDSDPALPVVSLDVPSPAVGTDTIWDAKGDLAAGTGADTAARLPVGSDGQYLIADSGEATGLAWAAGVNAFDDGEGDPADVSDTSGGADGVSTNVARRDHAHYHGSQTALPDAHHARSHDHSAAADDDALAPASLDVTAGPAKLSGELTPAQLTADTNDYDPADLATATVLRLSTDASHMLTGLAGGAAGRLLLLLNVGAENLILSDEDALSAAANRFALDASVTLTPDTAALLHYDTTAARWRLAALGKGSAGTVVGSDTLWDAKGDLAAGTGADTAGVLAVGSDGQVLQADSAQTTGLVWGSLAHSATSGQTTDDHHAKAHDHTTGDGSGVLTNDEHDGYAQYAELGADPATPAANKIRVYCKDNGSGVATLYYRSDSGTVYELPTLSSGGGSGAPSNASYVTLNAESKLTSETVLGTGVIMAGTAAGRPAASKAGRLYWTTDTYLLYRDTGATWTEIARGEAAVRLAQLAERDHASLASIGADDHHAQAHALDGADHTVSGLTPGDVLTATGAGTFAFQAPGAAGMALQELDGAPAGTFTTLKVTNGTLTDNGDGTATLATGAGGGDVATDPIFDAKGDLPVGTGADTAARLAAGSNGYFLTADSGEATGLKWNPQYEWVSFVIDGGGSAITTGIKGDFRVPAGTLVAAALLQDQSGSIVVDLWKDTFANFPPTDADSITSATPLTISSSATPVEDTTLSSWTTTCADGDVVRVNVDSCTSITRCSVCLKVRR